MKKIVLAAASAFALVVGAAPASAAPSFTLDFDPLLYTVQQNSSLAVTARVVNTGLTDITGFTQGFIFADPVPGATAVTGPSGGQSFFDQFNGLDVAPGEQFTFTFATYTFGATPPGTYALANSAFLSLNDGNGSTRVDARVFPSALVVSGGVPEPATWGLMLAGFGLVGAGLRQRRRGTAVTYA